MPLSEVRDLLNRYDIEYLPVTDSQDIIQGFIEKHLGWLSLVFTVLLIGGFFAIKHFMH